MFSGHYIIRLSYAPCLQIAEFFGDDLARLDAQAVAEPLSQVRVGRACKRISFRYTAKTEDAIIARHSHGGIDQTRWILPYPRRP